VPLPITARQRAALRQLRRTHPLLAALAVAVEQSFDSSKIDNPEIARVILDVTCQRIVRGDPLAADALVRHLDHFSSLDCFGPDQLADFLDQIHRLGILSTER
jgi:hypothetical protein